MRLQLFTLEAPALRDGSQLWEARAQVWVRVRRLRSRLSLASNVDELVATHAIRLRYVAGVKAGMRFRNDEHIFHIHNVENIGEHSRWLSCVCEERQLLGIEDAQ